MMENTKRTHKCGELTMANCGETVTLMGWVQRRRDHGGLIFVDLRDRYGLAQVVFDPEVGADIFTKAESLRNEYVIAVTGLVRQRPEGTTNENLATGEVEVKASDLKILNKAKTPPFYIEDGVDVDEMIRLKYRYLDLRRPEMQKALLMRHKVTMAAREFLNTKDFMEIETPMLTKSTPEGARDYLVPARLHPGEFYALPQSPQLFKQLLMVSGMERYFQLARCFRDEDLRADRQPEFTQLDMELSFVEQDDILDLTEELICYVFKKTMDRDIPRPFPRMTWADAMDKYGSDKPDLRFGMQLINVTDIVKDSDFKVFASVAQSGGEVKGICVKGGSSFSRREIDKLTEFVGIYGAKGLAYIYVEEDGLKSPVAKFFNEEQLAALRERMGGETGDLLMFVASTPNIVADALGHLRIEIAKLQGLIDENELNFSWVVDFPLLEYDDEEKRWVAIHHPFTSPKDEDLDILLTDPGKVRAKAYDMVLNGVEIGGGSIRIHRRDVQNKIFQLLGFSQEEAYAKFGFLLDAFEYGAPPHGGLAFGIDRVVMLMAGRETIRDVIAFPKTQSAACAMTQAPSAVENKQLRELYIKTDVPPNKQKGAKEQQ
ncbi:MAG: aspartate--tRNA ligase [Peptococcaceae bacterium]|nr:aspartate--tRNA ligase [Peptococcaceae bacterium]